MNIKHFLIILTIMLLICKYFRFINIDYIICFIPIILYMVYIFIFVSFNLIIIFNIILKEPKGKRIQKLEEILDTMEKAHK